MVGSRDEMREFVSQQAMKQAADQMLIDFKKGTFVSWQGRVCTYEQLPANMRAYSWTMNLALAREQALREYDAERSDGRPEEKL